MDNRGGEVVTKVSLSVASSQGKREGSKLERRTSRGGTEPGSGEGREVGRQAAGSLGAECGWHRAGHSLRTLDRRSAVLRPECLAGGLIRNPSFNSEGKMTSGEGVGCGSLLISSVWTFPWCVKPQTSPTSSGTKPLSTYCLHHI